MTAPAFRAASSTSGASGTQTIAAPTGLQVGDVMLMAFTIPSTATIGVPSGTWTVLDTGTTTGGAQNDQCKLWYRVATSGDVGATYTLTCSANRSTLGIVAYSGAASTTPPEVKSVTSADSTSFTGPAAATTSQVSTLVSIFAAETNLSSSTPAITLTAGPTQRLNTGDTFFSALAFAEDVQSVAGAGTARSATMNLTSSWVGYQVTLAPSPAAAAYRSPQISVIRQAVRRASVI